MHVDRIAKPCVKIEYTVMPKATNFVAITVRQTTLCEVLKQAKMSLSPLFVLTCVRSSDRLCVG